MRNGERSTRATPAPPATPQVGYELRAALRQPTVLCVEDDPEILDVLREYLTRQGFRVAAATNGVEAMFEAQRSLPEAMILDLFMPRLGGVGALDRIRRLVPEIVVVLISGHPQVLEMVTEAGVNVAGAFTKPLNLVAILGSLVEAGVIPQKRSETFSPEEARTELGGAPRRRVMVVDDDPDVREVLADYLRHKGYQVLEVESGEEALGQLPTFRPDVVLLDISMPGLSGMETLRRIKAAPQPTCVVMVSGQDDANMARQALGMVAADYIGKPVDFMYLDSVLQTQLLVG